MGYSECNRRDNQGLTLLELLITLSIVTILLTTAVPALSSLVARNVITSQANSMVAHLHLARSEAIKRQTRVSLCPSRDNMHCLESLEWHPGYMVFVNRDGDNELDDDELLLKSYQASSSRGGIYSTMARNRTTFKSDGTAKGTNGTFAICDAGETAQPRYLILSNTGRPRVSDTKPRTSKVTCG